METSSGLTVELVYMQPTDVWRATVRLPPGSTVAHALAIGRFSEHNPGYPYVVPRVGIFGHEYGLDHCLSDGDRLEIYRPLTFDPMESRRRRALHRKGRL